MTTTAFPRAVPREPVSAPPERTARIMSLDIVRGVAMLLMAIDHVRVYSGLPAGGPTPGIFFTRWVTHFVAPAFVFLAGTGAYLYGRRFASRAPLAKFLLTRGLWLVVLELTVLRLAWTFNFGYAHYELAGVIWMIGWCMVIMAALVFAPLGAIAAYGIAIIVFHNAMDFLSPTTVTAIRASSLAWLWQILYFGGPIVVGANKMHFDVLFSIVPWTGVMAAGYAFGAVMRMPAERRRTICLSLGVGAIVAFLVLRTLDVYGDPRHWHRPPPPPALLAFLGTSKYPASLLFLLMTLGPMLVAIPLLEHARGRVARILATYGRAPFFYYVLHIPLIHAAAIAVSLVRTGAVSPWLFGNHPYEPPPAPPGYTWSLSLLYLVTAIVIVILYFPSRWMATLKSRSRAAWLSYL